MTALYIVLGVLSYFVVGVCVHRFTDKDPDMMAGAIFWPLLALVAVPAALWVGLDWLLFTSWRRK